MSKTKLTDCVDNDSLCSYWASIGECIRFQNYMSEHCMKSCQLCGESDRLYLNENIKDIILLHVFKQTQGKFGNSYPHFTCIKKVYFKIHQATSNITIKTRPSPGSGNCT